MRREMNIIPDGHPNRPGKRLEALRAVVVHYTGNDRPGATDTANIAYMGRSFRMIDGAPFEMTDGKDGKPVPFRYGSAHVFIDQDSATLGIPLGEAAYGCGDRPLPYGPIDKGQRPFARKAFGHRQNYMAVQVEICNNDTEPGDGDWKRAVSNAEEWIIDFLLDRKLRVDIDGSLAPQDVKGPPADGYVYLVRHGDVTGKACPLPFYQDEKAWRQFVRIIGNVVNAVTMKGA